MKRQFNVRLSDVTQNQIADLLRWYGVTITTIIAMLIDRAWQAEQRRFERQSPAPRCAECGEIMHLEQTEGGDHYWQCPACPGIERD